MQRPGFHEILDALISLQPEPKEQSVLEKSETLTEFVDPLDEYERTTADVFRSQPLET